MNKVLELKKWQEAIPTPLLCKCAYCKKTPEVDYIVTDNFWKRVLPHRYWNGVVCLRCFYKMAVPVFASSSEFFTYIKKIYYAGDGFTMKLKIESLFRNNG